MVSRRLKTLINIDRELWSQFRAFSISKEFTVTASLELLLYETLKKRGYRIRNPILPKPCKEGEDVC